MSFITILSFQSTPIYTDVHFYLHPFILMLFIPMYIYLYGFLNLYLHLFTPTFLSLFTYYVYTDSLVSIYIYSHRLFNLYLNLFSKLQHLSNYISFWYMFSMTGVLLWTAIFLNTYNLYFYQSQCDKKHVFKDRLRSSLLKDTRQFKRLTMNRETRSSDDVADRTDRPPGAAPVQRESAGVGRRTWGWRRPTPHCRGESRPACGSLRIQSATSTMHVSCTTDQVIRRHLFYDAL